MMKTLWQDLRYGGRTLKKSSGFTVIAVLTLAVGIGANTAIFSVVNAVLLRPLPYPDSHRLVSIDSFNPASGEAAYGVSPADFLDWAAQNNSFSHAVAHTGGSLTVTGLSDAPEQFPGVRVSAEFFNALNVLPMLGRAPLAEEFQAGAPRVAALSHRLWMRRFGGDPSVVGRTLVLNNGEITVIGVMPPEFKYPAYSEVWSPLRADSGEWQNRGNRYFQAFARLRPGVTTEQAQAEINTIVARLTAAHPQTNANWSASLTPLQTKLAGAARPVLLILLGAVGLVLLIACANVANLLLARASARQKEVAIRLALGATRRRVVRQLLVESLLLAFIGGGLGLLVALWGVDALTALVPEAWRIPRLEESRIDLTVLAFTFAIAIATGVIFGLVPGLKASKPDLHESLKEGGKGAIGGLRTQRTRAALVVAEIALTLVLLIGAGLLIKSLSQLQQVDTGFDTQNLLTLNIGAPNRLYGQPQQLADFYRRFVERVETLPGVEAAALTSGAPLSGFNLAFPFRIEGHIADANALPQTAYSAISPNYFRAMRVPLRAGRELDERDARESPLVAIINETMARRHFAGVDPIGKRLTIDYLGTPATYEIIGVVSDTKQGDLSEEVSAEIYASYLQQPWLSSMMVVRTTNDVAAMSGSIQRAIREVDRTQAVASVKTMDALFAQSVSQPRFYTVLLVIFATVALALAAIGLYGVMSYTVAQRTHEIGVRMALGARPRDVLRLVVGQGIFLAGLGIGAGLIAAYALTRLMASLLFEVSATDPAIFGGISILLIVVALLACYVPARRAMKVDPMVALRYE